MSAFFAERKRFRKSVAPMVFKKQPDFQCPEIAAQDETFGRRILCHFQTTKANLAWLPGNF
jgi:hypothetical protein